MLITYNSPFLNKLNITESEVGTAVAAIKAASTAIEKYCNRSFALANYSQNIETTQDGYAVLRNFPVVSVTNIATELTNVLDVTNIVTSNSSATIYTTSTSLVVVRVASGVETTSEFLFSEYTTIDSMKDAINDLGNGWVATTDTGYGTYPSADILEGQFIDCKSGTGSIDSWVNGCRSTHVEFETGIVWGLPRYSRIRIKYRAGFATIPSPIQQVTANLVANIFDDKSRNVVSERLGDYSYSLSSTAMDRLPIQDKQILDMYRDRRV